MNWLVAIIYGHQMSNINNEKEINGQRKEKIISLEDNSK